MCISLWSPVKQQYTGTNTTNILNPKLSKEIGLKWLSSYERSIRHIQQIKIGPLSEVFYKKQNLPDFQIHFFTSTDL